MFYSPRDTVTPHFIYGEEDIAAGAKEYKAVLGVHLPALSASSSSLQIDYRLSQCLFAGL